MLGYPGGSNRVATVTRGTQTIRSFTYDGAGNILTDNGTGGNKGYVYNNRNRLSQATVGALVYNYTYNALEQLVIRAQVSPAATTHFIHDRMGNVIAETAGGGPTGTTGTVREYIWLPETEIAPTMSSRTVVDRPLAVVDLVNTASPVTYWISVDHLNRPVQMWNGAKVSVWQATWLPWGGVQSVTGTATLNARFPGQWFQSETGLHYNWHRSYDPTLGRYTQPDPLGFVDGPSVYGYAGGSPHMFVDRDGRFAYPAGQVIVTGIMILIELSKPPLPDLTPPRPEPTPAPELKQCPKVCPPCKTQSGKIVELNSIGCRFDKVPPGDKHFPCPGDHYNCQQAYQNPNNCRCFWSTPKRPTKDVYCSPEETPPPNWIELEPIN